MTYLSTVEKLRSLATEDEEPRFKNCEDGYISLLLDRPDLADSSLRYLAPQHFGTIYHQYIAAHLQKYFEEHGTTPTREVLREIVVREMTVDDPVDDILRLIGRPSDPREEGYLRKELCAWAKDRAYARLYSDEGQDAFHRGDYQMLRAIIDDAESIDAAEDDEFGFVNAADFMQQETERAWLVEGALVARQPCLIGGRKKVLKTGILCDLAISLATGGKFLGHFSTPRPVNVALFSCESGEDDIRDRIAAICRTRQIEDGLERLFLSFKRPKLSNDAHLALIAKFLERHQIAVIIIDPLYLTLLTGNKQASSANLYDMGDVFARIADVCDKHGTTPILCHHFKKSAGEELDLDDLTFAGGGEFARQSILIKRRGIFETPTNNQLSLRFHGYGRGGLYRAMIDEGELDEQRWVVRMEAETESRAREARTSNSSLLAALLNAMSDLTDGGDSDGLLSKRQIREELHWNNDKVSTAIERAIEEGSVQQQVTTSGIRYRRVA
jgi:hypothetical protein